jgi:PilZ domain
MQERRIAQRTRIIKAAGLFGLAHLGDCVVHDISASGARLVMASTSSVPDTFDLSFDSARTLRSCRVAWRTATEIGLQFQQRSLRSAVA